MMPGDTNALTRRGRCRGFTLIELLIVVGILGILMALAAGAVVTAKNSSRNSTTETTIRKVNRMLERQYRAATDTARDAAIPLSIKALARNPLTGVDDLDRARAIWIKMWLVWDFPVTYAEVQAPPQFAQKPEYINALNAGMAGQPFESAACLYLALNVRGRRGVAVDTESFAANEVRTDTSTGTPIKYLVDGWGNPLAFFRWPTNNDDLNPPGQAQPPSSPRDPLDPLGRLLDPSWNNLNNATTITTLESSSFIGHPLHQGNWIRVAYNLVPVVVSAGKDGNLGLDSVMNGVYSSAGMDNIYSYRLR
jgi:prepilin-type N-terminal cleavage/methylation domain-containing protein